MKTFGIFVTATLLGTGNLVLGFYAVGSIIGHWGLVDILSPLLDFKTFIGARFIIGIFIDGIQGSLIDINTKFTEQGDNLLNKIRPALFTTLAIIITVCLSYLYSLIIM